MHGKTRRPPPTTIGPVTPLSPLLRRVLRQRLYPLLLCLSAMATAAPFTPASDAQVLATVPARASDPAARELAALRQAWRQQPNDLSTALRLAERSFAQVLIFFGNCQFQAEWI